jgi:hypothetical protein
VALRPRLSPGVPLSERMANECQCAKWCRRRQDRSDPAVGRRACWAPVGSSAGSGRSLREARFIPARGPDTAAQEPEADHAAQQRKQPPGGVQDEGALGERRLVEYRDAAAHLVTRERQELTRGSDRLARGPSGAPCRSPMPSRIVVLVFDERGDGQGQEHPAQKGMRQSYLRRPRAAGSGTQGGALQLARL